LPLYISSEFGVETPIRLFEAKQYGVLSEMKSLVCKNFFGGIMKSKTSKIGVNYFLSVFFTFVLFVASVSATTTTVPTNSTLPVNIPDGNMTFTCINFPVTGIPSGEGVNAVTVTFGIEHECVGDMQMELRAPGGSLIRMLFGNVSIGGCPGGGSGMFDANGLYTFTDAAAQSMNSQEVAFVPPGNYRSADYRTPMNPNPQTTSLNALFGGMTSTQANGTWQLCGRDQFPSDVGRLKTSASITISSSVPTAATVSVGGRVLSQFGNGISGAFVTLTDQEGNSQTVRTNPFGYFRLSDVEAGQSYVLSVSSKGHRFTTQFVSVNENVESLTIVSQ
jgi:subtilisin-like proprotein convertase family protein